MIPEYLRSDHAVCTSWGCEQAVKLNPETGRYFITIGHPGFNSKTNNAGGYKTPRVARSVIRWYCEKRTGGVEDASED